MKRNNRVSWKYPSYDEEGYKELCAKSTGNDFYYCVGFDLSGKTYAAITPKEYFDSWGEIWYRVVDTKAFLPTDHLTPYQGRKKDEWSEANIWISDLTMEETQALFHAYGIEQNKQFGQLLELKFFKKPLTPDMEMDFSEFQTLMKETAANLKKMRAAQDYMRWQFGTPFYYEEFLSEMTETMNGWISSHC